MKEILIATIESFLRAIIRFWDNRFNKSDEIYWLRERNAELYKFIFSRLESNNPTAEEPESEELEELQPLGHPIETMLSKRRRLENETLVRWTKSVQEAKDELVRQKVNSTSKSTSELEEELLKVEN